MLFRSVRVRVPWRRVTPVRTVWRRPRRDWSISKASAGPAGLPRRQGTRTLTQSEATEVLFREVSDRELQAYVRTGEPLDKAGSYGIQGVGALLVERIHGDYFNVMGLPLLRLSRMLAEFGVPLL